MTIEELIRTLEYYKKDQSPNKTVYVCEFGVRKQEYREISHVNNGISEVLIILKEVKYLSN